MVIRINGCTIKTTKKYGIVTIFLSTTVVLIFFNFKKFWLLNNLNTIKENYSTKYNTKIIFWLLMKIDKMFWRKKKIKIKTTKTMRKLLVDENSK